MHSPRQVAHADLAATHARVTLRLTWIISLSMLVAMMDRNNLALAALKMRPAIGLTATMLGIGTALFYVAYLVGSIPSNILLARFGARRWIARIMISWGFVCACMAFAWDAHSFYVLRFLLGVAEAGFLPGVFLYLTLWVPQERRGRMNSYFLMAVPVSGVITAVVSGLILRLDGFMGFAGWQLIFLIEALPAVLLGIVVLLYLDDRPEDAAWLSPAQKTLLARALAAERADDGRPEASAGAVIAALVRRPEVIVLLLGYFGLNVGLSSLIWVPQILETFALTAFEIALLSALPAGASVIAMAIWARRSDITGERRGHYFAATLLCAVGFALAALPASLYGSIIGLMLASGGAFAAFAVFWTLPPSVLSVRERPVGIAFISLFGVVAGMTSPVVIGYLKDATGGYAPALFLGALCPLLGGLIIWLGLRRSAAIAVARSAH
ncbi:MAG: MFS transporter [Steroidobacteraceae bacterium]